MERLSEHFSLEELCVTQVRDVNNEPQGHIYKNLRDTAQRMEEIRAILDNKPIIVTSGYRSALVNKIVGGSPSSAHMRGYAVDFICPAFGSPYECCATISASKVFFDQLIFEETWVHVSFAPRLRGQVLTKRRHGTFVSGLRRGEKGES